MTKENGAPGESGAAGGGDKEQINTPEEAFIWLKNYFGLTFFPTYFERRACRYIGTNKQVRGFLVTAVLYEQANKKEGVKEKIRIGIGFEDMPEDEFWIIGKDGVICANSRYVSSLFKITGEKVILRNPGFPVSGAVSCENAEDPKKFRNLVFGIIDWLSH